jgi:hypothetical protein
MAKHCTHCIQTGIASQQRTLPTPGAAAAAAVETSQHSENFITRFTGWWKVGEDGDSKLPPPGSLSKLRATVWQIARPDAKLLVLAVVFLVSKSALHAYRLRR